MDEPNETRVTAPPAEVAERGDIRHQRKTYQVSLRVTSPFSARHLCGLLLELLQKRGDVVETIRIRPDVVPMASYDRPRSER